jgi:hypothetical protein
VEEREGEAKVIKAQQVHRVIVAVGMECAVHTCLQTSQSMVRQMQKNMMPVSVNMQSHDMYASHHITLNPTCSQAGAVRPPSQSLTQRQCRSW